MKCTVLMDNQANPSRTDLGNEHGLSALIETKANTILFDSGASDLFIQNSGHLNINLRAVDTVVLSHGHYDHGGGLAAFLKINDKATIYCGPGALDIHVAKLYGLFSRNIGLNRRALEPFLSRFVTVETLSEIAPDVYVLPHIPFAYPAPNDMSKFYKKSANHLQKDDFTHEILLIVREANDLTVLTGCAHKGILNVVSAVIGNFPSASVAVLVGGLHMMNPATKWLLGTEADINHIGAELKKNNTLKKLYAGHCTGQKAYSLLRQQMGSKIESLMVGKQIVS